MKQAPVPENTPLPRYLCDTDRRSRSLTRHFFARQRSESVLRPTPIPLPRPMPNPPSDSIVYPRRAPEQSQESRHRHPAERAGGGHGRLRVGKVVPRLRHPLRRRPAPLRRDLLALRAAVPRPAGPPPGRSDRRHSSCDRHRPDESRPDLALDGGDHERAERPPEAALCARRAALLPRMRATGAARYAGFDPPGPRGPGRRCRRPAACDHVSGRGTEELRRRGSAEAPRGAGVYPRPRPHQDHTRGRAGPVPDVERRAHAGDRGAGGSAPSRAGAGKRIHPHGRRQRRGSADLRRLIRHS